MLSTIPSYLALSDLGFSSAATSKMSGQFARGELQQLKCTFQSVWLLNGFLSVVVIALATIAIFVLLPHFPLFYRERAVLFYLLIYSALVMNTRVWLGAFRATHNYATGTLLYDAWLPIEMLASLVAVYVGGDLVSAAATMLGMRIISSLIMGFLLRRRLRWLTLGVQAASFAEVRQLAPPAFGALAIPIALSLNLQGTLLVAGLAISPTAAATLAAVRTVTRSAIQAVAVVNRATMPELAAAWALKHTDLFKRMVAVNLGSLAIVLLPASAIFAFFGKSIVDVWTHGAIQPSANFIFLMALALPIHGYWYFTLNLLLASNQHTKISLQLAIVAAAALIPSAIMAKLFDLNGIACTLLCFEATCGLLVTNCFRTAYYNTKGPDTRMTVA
ncbi:hypothetical protein [Bradyrhizobium sp. USDA 336]|uniref:hypothetical protein n=1 Tax=Bradyrhizobium sp. USDA 336 TaxID=3156311 RepID=UPI00384DF3C4